MSELNITALDKYQRPITINHSEVEFIYPENGKTYKGVVVDVRSISMEAYIVVETAGGRKIVCAASTEIVHTRVEQHAAVYIQQQLFELLGHMPKIKFSAGSGLDQVITASGNKTLYAREAIAIVELSGKTGANFWFESVSGKTRVCFQVPATKKIVA